MHRLGTHPARIRSEAAHPIQKKLQAPMNGIIDIESDKDSHDSVISHQSSDTTAGGGCPHAVFWADD